MLSGAWIAGRCPYQGCIAMRLSILWLIARMHLGCLRRHISCTKESQIDEIKQVSWFADECTSQLGTYLTLQDCPSGSGLKRKNRSAPVRAHADRQADVCLQEECHYHQMIWPQKISKVRQQSWGVNLSISGSSLGKWLRRLAGEDGAQTMRLTKYGSQWQL